jgi:hypothetical protein
LAPLLSTVLETRTSTAAQGALTERAIALALRDRTTICQRSVLAAEVPEALAALRETV